MSSVPEGADGAPAAGAAAAESLRDSPWDLADFPVPLIDLSRTFEGFLGLQWIELTSEVARVQFDVRENLKQPLGLLHRGVDPAVWEEGKIGSGLSNSASFLRPVTAGTVHVSARCRGHDDREWTWAHEFRDDADRLCALVDVTIAVRPRPS